MFTISRSQNRFLKNTKSASTMTATMRGLDKVRAEFSLTALAYNLRRALRFTLITSRNEPN
jgi:hypothetical protein